MPKIDLDLGEFTHDGDPADIERRAFDGLVARGLPVEIAARAAEHVMRSILETRAEVEMERALRAEVASLRRRLALTGWILLATGLMLMARVAIDVAAWLHQH
jgi:hypothetical protein